MSERPPPGRGAAVLIAAASGRALAAAASRAGYAPLVADFFADADTQRLAASACRGGSVEAGFEPEILLDALEGLAQGRAPIGLVYGSGFEDRPALLDAIARRWPLLGNAADTVRRAKDPAALAALCRTLAIPHPDTSLAAPENAAGWLVKSAGAGGGSHVAPADAADAPGESIYFQRRVPGEPVSLFCLCDGAGMRALGASRQWAAPAPGEPYRFGGCVRPAGLSAGLERRLADAAGALAAALSLRGLSSFDFLVDGDAFALIEINPRPGATLDIFEDRDGLLFQAHIDACRGAPPPALVFEAAAASEIVYARRAIAALPALRWPVWTADQPEATTPLRLYDPLCTVKASAADAESAAALVRARAAAVLDGIDRFETGEPPWA